MNKIKNVMMNKMMNKVCKAVLKGQDKMDQAVEKFKNEEVGASELVVLVALIVITLAIVVVFRTQLINIINAVGNKVINWINAN